MERTVGMPANPPLETLETLVMASEAGRACRPLRGEPIEETLEAEVVARRSTSRSASSAGIS